MSKKSAIIILRHGCDGGDGDKGNFTFGEKVSLFFHGNDGKVEGNTVYYERDFLSKLGHQEATALGNELPDWINNQFQPVSRVISEGPGIKRREIDGTPNPINTIRPYIDKLCDKDLFKSPTGKLTVDLYDNKVSKDPNIFSVDKLLADGIGSYSTVVSWEAKGMWRDDKKIFVEDSILGKLSEGLDNRFLLSDSYYDEEKKEERGHNRPWKGRMIYVFEVQDDHSLIMKVYEFISKEDGSGSFHEITKSEDWPKKIC